MRQQTDSLPQMEPATLRGVLPVTNLAARRRDERGQDADEGGLACAIRAEQAHDVTGVEGERDFGQGPSPAEVSRHVGQPNGKPSPGSCRRRRRGILPLRLRQMRERGRHVRPRGIGPHRALPDLGGELHHLAAEGGERDRRQLARHLSARAEILHELPHVGERLARLDLQPLQRGPVTHPDAEAEARARQLVDERGGVRVVVGMARVDVGDARAERDLARPKGERLAEPEPVAEAGADRCPRSLPSRCAARARAWSDDVRPRRPG